MFSKAFFSCEKSLCYFQYYTFTWSSNVTFQNFDVLEFVKRLCSAVKNFHNNNVGIVTSGFTFKKGATTQVLRKVRILTKFGFCYTLRENVKIRKMQISFGQVMQHFRLGVFIDVSVYISPVSSKFIKERHVTSVAD